MNNTAAKLSFLAHVVDRGLGQVMNSPDVPTPTGGMSHDKKLAFLQAITKHGLQHLDIGGAIGAIGGGIQNVLGGIGGATQGIAQDFTTQNQFQAGKAPITAGTNAEQIAQSGQNAYGAIQQQQGLANTLNAGVNQGAGAQNYLSNQLMAEANGQGPNPAQAQYQQNVNNLASQQAGAIASTKGISPALQARLISQQGSAAQQNAAGQAATLQAQQQLAAQNNLQNLSANQVAQGAGAVQGLNNATQNEQNILQGANTSFNNALVSQQANVNNVNASVAGQNAAAVNQTQGGLLGGISSFLGFAHGGEVKGVGYADGGLVATQTSGPQSYVGQWLNSSGNMTAPSVESSSPMAGISMAGSGGQDFTGNGLESILSGVAAKTAGGKPPGVGDLGDFSAGGLGAVVAAKGGKIDAKTDGQKAKAKGDDLKNDKIPAMLSEGEVVMDRETLADKGHIGQMARAVAAHIAARNKGKK